MKDAMDKTKKILIPLGVFVCALLPRILFLGSVYYADEPLWIKRIVTFILEIMNRNWSGTFITAHPGVTNMWLSGIPLFINAVFLKRTDLLFTLLISRIPIALTIAIAVLSLYFFTKKIFGQKIAILGCLLIAFDPFYIAFSRALSLDAVVTTFMALSALTFISYLNHNTKDDLVRSGFFAGLAFLTKTPALFLIPFVILAVIVWHAPMLFERREGAVRPRILHILTAFFIWAVVLTTVFVILWPAMWVGPKYVISQMFLDIKGVTAVPHGSDFFMGRISDGTYKGIYGLYYYLVYLVFRLTPASLPFFIFYAVCFMIQLKKTGFNPANKSALLLFCYVIFFILMATLTAKKGDRYLLPIFPVIDILAAAGIYHFVNLVKNKFHLNASKSGIYLTAGIYICAVIIQALASLTLIPYSSAYYNPLLGGPAVAKNILCIGGGEGLDQAAGYLNQKPNGKDLKVCVEYTGFNEYFLGHVVVGADDADYIVFYICARQRGWNDKVWKRYKDKVPEHVVRINGIDYAWIYKIQK